MSKKNSSGKFWPYMILGFLFIGIILGYWTVKSAISLPVQESNEYLKKYQSVDKKSREIQEAEERFNKEYNVTISGLEKSDFKEKNIKRKPYTHYKLEDSNKITIKVTKKDGEVAKDMNVTLLLTRPQTTKDDKLYKDIPFKDGYYIIDNIEVKSKGRYILRFKIQKDDKEKFIDMYGVKE